jgi:hypothetical protein
MLGMTTLFSREATPRGFNASVYRMRSSARGWKTMMKRKYLVAGGLVLLAVPVLVMGQGGVHSAKGSGDAGFDGTWIVDFQGAMSRKVMFGW